MRAILLAILMAVSLLARADYIDLEGADVLHAGRCVDNGKQFMCALLDFKGNNYFVLVDQKGEYAIYLSTEKGMELIWSRASV